MTDAAIHQLLDTLHATAKRCSPFAGLPIHGDNSERILFVAIVREWLAQNKPESQR